MDKHVLEDYLKDKFVIAGTGSRSFHLVEHQAEPNQRLHDQMVMNLEAHPNLVVMSGGAEGWDETVASIARNLHIPYVMCIPNKGYGDYYWRRHSVHHRDRMAEFDEMLEKAAAIEYVMEDVYHSSRLYVKGVHSNFVRNWRMVELARAFWVYGPTSRGTKDCLDRIKQVGKPYKILG